MTQRESARAGVIATLLARRKLSILLLAGITVTLVVGLAPRAWATPGQSPLRQTVPPPSSIGGTVYLDTNRNQMEDVGEPGIPDVQLTLITGGTTSLITRTNTLGHYVFPGLLPGRLYTVTETTPVGYSSTTADLVEVTLPPDGTLQVGVVVDFGDYKATLLLPAIVKE